MESSSPGTLAAALQLSDASGCPLPLSRSTTVLTGTPDVQASFGDRAIFVSTTGSDSEGDGSPSKPFATPGRAAEAVAALPRPLAANVLVNLAPGTYTVPAGLELSDAHSGSGKDAIVTWQTDRSANATPASRRFDGSKNTRAVISGASPLGRLQWVQEPSESQKPSPGWMNVPLHQALLALARTDASRDIAHLPQLIAVAEAAAKASRLPASLTTPVAGGDDAGSDVIVSPSASASVSASACASWCKGTWKRPADSPLCTSWTFFPASSLSVAATLAALFGPTAVGTSPDVQGPLPSVCSGRTSSVWSPFRSHALSADPKLRGVPLPVVSGVSAPVYSAKVPAGLLPEGRTIRSLYFNGTGAANRFTLARFPNGNDTVPPPAGYIEANGGFPDNPQPTGAVQPLNLSVLLKNTPLAAGVSPPGFVGANISVSAPASQPTATYPKGSCVSFQAVEGGSMDRFVTTEGLVPFWNSAVCKGMYYDPSTFSPRTWSNASEARVTMFQTHTWGNWGFDVGERDDSTHSLTFTGGGFQEARGGGINTEHAGSGPEGGGNKFFVDGVREELDAVGEFYYDAVAATLLIVPLSPDMAASLQWTEFWAPMAANVVTIAGSTSKPAAYQTLSDLDVTHSAEQFYDGPFEAPPGGDWALVRRGAIKLDGVDMVNVSGVSVLSPGSNGIVLSNRASNISVAGCLVQDAGESGVLVIGTTRLMDGFSELSQPRDSVIVGNYIHDVGRIGKQAAPVFIGISQGIRLENNVLHTGPRAGINLNDPYAGGHSLQGNLLFATCRSTWDHGAINSWGREPFIYPAPSTSTGLAVTPSTTTIANNFLINHNYGPGHPNSDKLVDLDDGSTSFSVRNNVLLYGGIKFRDGRFRTGHDNLILFPETQNADFTILPGLFLGPMGESVHAYYSRSTDFFQNNTVLSATGAFYSCSPGWTEANFPAIASNTFFTPGDTRLPFDVSGCGGKVTTLQEWQKDGHDKDSTISSNVDFNAVIDQAKQLLGLQQQLAAM